MSRTMQGKPNGLPRLAQRAGIESFHDEADLMHAHAAPVGGVEDVVADLLDDLVQFEFDLLGFILYAFPWGEEGPLRDEPGPEEWQEQAAQRISDKLRNGGDLGAVLEEDFVAGHGVGKSAFVAWVILWAISTKPQTRGVVTANTESQLKTKTWAELGKWKNLFVASELFTYTATSIYSSDKRYEKTWRVDAIPWSATNPVAFAGLHNRGLRQFMLFDEASAIDKVIWDSAAGFLTDDKTQVLWLRFGNPTDPTGVFHKNCTRRGRNTVTRIDSRTVRFSNKLQIQAWADEYGEDSDFFRVRVKGQFPRHGLSSFLSPELVEEARIRHVHPSAYRSWPLYMSIDPARFGDDWTIITLRQGIKCHWQVGMYGFDGPDVTGRVSELLLQFPGVRAIVYDAVGNGADLDSSLRRASGMPDLVPIQWGIPATESKQYFNQRAEAYGHLKEWLKGGSIPDDDDLGDQLTSVDYGHDRLNRIQLETKQDMRRRGIKSPDKADSLALSFLLDLMQTQSHKVPVRPATPRRIVWTKN